MDSMRFDALAKRFGGSRRRLLRGVGLVGFGALAPTQMRSSPAAAQTTNSVEVCTSCAGPFDDSPVSGGLPTFVIVHGGWLGGSQWTPTANRLRAAGHEVFTPTLTGIGERAHLLTPAVDLATHIQDVVGVLECENLRNVILVGHSSGSMVISGVAERVPRRLSRIVYVDTVIPNDGQSFFDLIGEPASGALTEAAQTQGDGWRIPSPFASPDATCLPFHPLATVTSPLIVSNPTAAALPRTFIFCTGKGDDWFLGIGGKIAAAAQRAKAAGWDYRELPTGHSPHLEMPEAFAELLMSLA